jgi:hypothetical protein
VLNKVGEIMTRFFLQKIIFVLTVSNYFSSIVALPILSKVGKHPYDHDFDKSMEFSKKTHQKEREKKRITPLQDFVKKFIIKII